MLMLPKTFPNQTFETITGHGEFYMFTWYREAKPCRLTPGILPEYHKIFISGTAGRGKYVFKFSGLGQALRAGETPTGVGGDLVDNRLDSQALTALGATTVQYLATVTGAHAGTEAVSTFAFNLAGLKSSFHGRYRV